MEWYHWLIIYLYGATISGIAFHVLARNRSIQNETAAVIFATVFWPITLPSYILVSVLSDD